MLKWLIGLFASISAVFTGETNKPITIPPLNTAIITYQETYYAPVVADLGNFPWAKQITETKTSTTKPTVEIKTTVTPSPLPATPPPPPPPAPVSIADVYLTNPEPIVDWYMPVTLRGNSTNNATSTLPEMTFNKEFWRIEVLTYWAPGDSSRPPVENDYFKLEVYEKGIDKLVYTMTSGSNDSIHKFQTFKKPGTYYFKVYLKTPSQYEITFTYH